MLKIQLRITEINYTLQYIQLFFLIVILFHNITVFTAYCFFHQINAAL